MKVQKLLPFLVLVALMACVPVASPTTSPPTVLPPADTVAAPTATDTHTANVVSEKTPTVPPSATAPATNTAPSPTSARPTDTPTASPMPTQTPTPDYYTVEERNLMNYDWHTDKFMLSTFPSDVAPYCIDRYKGKGMTLRFQLPKPGGQLITPGAFYHRVSPNNWASGSTSPYDSRDSVIDFLKVTQNQMTETMIGKGIVGSVTCTSVWVRVGSP
jgi:hypothetical protein